MDTAYVAVEEELLTVRDPLEDPRTERRLADHDPECVLADARRPDRVLVGTFDAGLLRSTDTGGTFAPANDGIEEASVMSLAAAPDDPDTLYAGTEPSAVYRSRDGGKTWRRLDGLRDLPSEPGWSFPPRPDTHHTRWISVAPDDPEHLYVGIEAGALVQSHDGGETWEDRVSDSRVDNHTLATHPDAPDRVYSAAGDGYAESHDAGATWAHPQEGLDHRYCWGLAVDPGDPETVLVSAASGAGNAHRSPGESYVYRGRPNDDSDRTWTRLEDTGLPTGEGVLRAVFQAGTDPGEVWAANDHGLFRTTDAGDSWTAVDIAWPDAFRGQTVRGLAVV